MSISKRLNSKNDLSSQGLTKRDQKDHKQAQNKIYFMSYQAMKFIPQKAMKWRS